MKLQVSRGSENTNSAELVGELADNYPLGVLSPLHLSANFYIPPPPEKVPLPPSSAVTRGGRGGIS